jgi:hypothetical protein
MSAALAPFQAARSDVLQSIRFGTIRGRLNLRGIFGCFVRFSSSLAYFLFHLFWSAQEFFLTRFHLIERSESVAANISGNDFSVTFGLELALVSEADDAFAP